MSKVLYHHRQTGAAVSSYATLAHPSADSETLSGEPLHFLLHSPMQRTRVAQGCDYQRTMPNLELLTHTMSHALVDVTVLHENRLATAVM